MKTGWTTHSWNGAIWLALRPCHMTMTCKINKLEKPTGPLGIFHALFGRSAAFYSHFRRDTVTSEWSTRISTSILLCYITKSRLNVQFVKEISPGNSHWSTNERKRVWSKLIMVFTLNFLSICCLSMICK